MNDLDPAAATPGAGPSEPPPRRKPSRPRAAVATLTAAPALALTALAAAPLTAAVRIASHFGDPQTVTLLADRCDYALTSGALHVLKWPECAGD